MAADGCGGGICWRRRLASEEGANLVESAVSMILLLMIIFGIMDCSRALYVDHYVRYTAEEAARYAMVRGASWSGVACSTPLTMSCTATADNVEAEVGYVMPPGIIAAGNLTVTTSWPGTNSIGTACSTANGVNSPGCVVQVTVTSNFNFILPFLPTSAMVLSSSSSRPISQ